MVSDLLMGSERNGRGQWPGLARPSGITGASRGQRGGGEGAGGSKERPRAPQGCLRLQALLSLLITCNLPAWLPSNQIASIMWL